MTVLHLSAFTFSGFMPSLSGAQWPRGVFSVSRLYLCANKRSQLVCVAPNRGHSDQDTEDLEIRVNYTAGGNHC